MLPLPLALEPGEPRLLHRASNRVPLTSDTGGCVGAAAWQGHAVTRRQARADGRGGGRGLPRSRVDVSGAWCGRDNGLDVRTVSGGVRGGGGGALPSRSPFEKMAIVP
jgi:hypothetical protein